MLKGIGKSHGKTIIMGEHAVVYGYPAFAIPLLSIPVIVKMQQSKENSLISKYYAGKIDKIPDSLSGVKYLVSLLDSELNKDHLNYTINIDSGLPIERGMGSSAAIAAAITRAFFNFFNKDLSHQLLLDYVNKSETITHGKASGLDALTVSSDDPIKFGKDVEPEHFNFNSDGFIVIADSGVKGRTKETVADVRKMYDQEPKKIGAYLQQLGDYATQASDYLIKGNLKKLGLVFTLANEALTKLNLAIPKTDKLIEAANHAGALGSKITGGGRGGCIICLARNLKNAQMIQKALIKSGAEQTWIQPLSIYAEDEDIG
ncbi:mevalonate kinase [Companilactobacillus bobalius]|uniref:Mevalonate kinase n=1 Tax=Companilactobacillus bobalius TaxID=2801451 RepID=A0A202FF48_9LACO|nr:mevalonate kinase [Companilactobacillus bobalius]OVE99119.1 Mevalonate kinase [Companilactobacillus bobalius]GEO57095.1 mevalonate kinase [Companilactobacillus paralimentarius]